MGRDDVTPGAVVSIQTFGNLADLNPHIHMIVSWGCFDNSGGHYSNKSRGMRKKQAALAGEGPPVSQAYLDEVANNHFCGFSCRLLTGGSGTLDFRSAWEEDVNMRGSKSALGERLLGFAKIQLPIT